MDINILNSFLFHPRKANGSMRENDQLIAVEESVKVGVRYHLVNPKSPNILFFHGNGEIAPEYDDIASIYNQRGFNFMVADFRGYGFSSGVPNVKNTQSDAHLILDAVLSYLSEKEHLGNLVLMGRSLGSVSVIELTKRYPEDFKGLIIESGISNESPLFNLIGVSAEDVGYKKEDGFQNDEKMKQYNGPLLVIHAEQDHIVPFSQGKELVELCPSMNKNLVAIAHANHNNILGVDPEKYFLEVTEFISSLK